MQGDLVTKVWLSPNYPCVLEVSGTLRQDLGGSEAWKPQYGLIARSLQPLSIGPICAENGRRIQVGLQAHDNFGGHYEDCSAGGIGEEP